MPVDDEADESLTKRPKVHTAAPLSASAAHEINNPLDSLLNLLHLLQAEPLSERGRHQLHLAQQEVQRISLIARETLNQHRIETLPRSANVAELFADVLDFYKEKFASSGIAVATRWSGDSNIPVFAGPLRQVFSNLLLNDLSDHPKPAISNHLKTGQREYRPGH